MHKENPDMVIIIPALNEQESITLVLKSLQSSPYANRIIDIIVVDNGSTDLTAKLAKDCGVMVLSEPRRGYGQACLTGLAKAFELESQHIIFVDADFSDNPLEFIKILEELDAGADLVIGSRMLGKAEPGSLLPQAKYGNKLATFLLQLLFGGFRFTDLGPFRGMRTDALKSIQMEDRNFGWTIEMQIKALVNNLICREVSVSYKKRIGISKITGTIKGTLFASIKIIYCIFFYFFKLIVFKKV
jgi:glycosyltransferase involved in cell wall biosynthesis